MPSFVASSIRRAVRWAAFLLSALVLALSAPAQQDNEDPSELFLKAFTSVQQGEKLERDGQIKLAISKFRFASTLLEQISQRNPNWQPLIVQYRSRKTGEAIVRAEQRLQFEKPGDPRPAAEPAAAPKATPAAIPRSTPPPPVPGGNARAPRYVPSGDGTDPLPTNEPEYFSNRTLPEAGAARMPTPPPEVPTRSTQEARGKLEKLQKELEENRKALAAAKEERDKLELQLQSTRIEVRTEKKRAERATSEVTDLETQLKRAKDTAQEALSRNPDAAETRKALREQVAELKKQVAAAEGRADSTGKEREEAARKLAEASERLGGLTKERDTATERADAAKDANTRIDTLLASNVELTKKLETAEGAVQRLTAESDEKKKETEQLRGEIVSIRDQLALARTQNDKFETNITELNARLEQTTKDLADVRKQGVTSEEKQRMTKENELLKGIVLQQLKEQAKREQARKLLTQELARLEVQSKTLNDQVALLGSPTIQLTDEMRAMFRDTEITSGSANSSSMEGIIIGIKRDGKGDGKPDESAGDALPGSTPPTGPQVETNLNPRVPDELLPVAREMKEQIDGGRFTDAEKSAERILAKDPQNLYARSNLGVAQLRQGKLKQAEITLKRALMGNPNDAFSRSSLGIVYYRMKKLDDAIDQLTKAIALDPKSATAHNHLGIVAGQKGWPEAAEQEFKKAIALNPGYADAHFNLAVVYATGEPPSKQLADQHYKKATQLGASPDPALERLIRN